MLLSRRSTIDFGRESCRSCGVDVGDDMVIVGYRAYHRECAVVTNRPDETAVERARLRRIGEWARWLGWGQGASG